MANIFMRHLEQKFSDFNGNPPLFYCCYVDDSLLLFQRKTDVAPFFDFVNSLHPNIKFTKEEEREDSSFFPFLDVQIIRTTTGFLTKTYYKPTFTGLYTNWYSFTQQKYKINLVKCLLLRVWKICSNISLFNGNWSTIKINLIKNQYPEALLISLHRNFVQRQQEQPTEPITTVSKMDVLLVLPYHVFNLSNRLSKSLKSLFCNAYPQVNLK